MELNAETLEKSLTKCCTKCSAIKPLDEFANNKSSTATHNSLVFQILGCRSKTAAASTQSR